MPDSTALERPEFRVSWRGGRAGGQGREAALAGWGRSGALVGSGRGGDGTAGDGDAALRRGRGARAARGTRAGRRRCAGRGGALGARPGFGEADRAAVRVAGDADREAGG